MSFESKICVVLIPVLNEAEHINELISRFTNLNLKINASDFTSLDKNGVQNTVMSNPSSYELFVVFIDDGSTDGTVEFIRFASETTELKIHLIDRGVQPRKGNNRGSALMSGLGFAIDSLNADLIIEIDGDLSHDPLEILDHLRAHNQFPGGVVISSKYLEQSSITGRPLSRRVISFYATLFMKILTGSTVSDWTNGFRSYHKECGQLLIQHKKVSQGPLFITNSLAYWLSIGVSIRFVPTTYRGRQNGQSKLTWQDILKASIGYIQIGIKYRLKRF